MVRGGNRRGPPRNLIWYGIAYYSKSSLIVILRTTLDARIDTTDVSNKLKILKGLDNGSEELDEKNWMQN